MKDISDKNIESSDQIISPKELKKTVNGFDLWPSVVRWRKVIEDILDGTDK
ncbi:3-deoxy-7-phosphoheptulonate synthase, partial [Candidatus Woesearchaeota archaeon]|nr:3-deoxy-7-phosphoheptulonate synthase [Candidatus Woesearchaeota archaeon]